MARERANIEQPGATGVESRICDDLDCHHGDDADSDEGAREDGESNIQNKRIRNNNNNHVSKGVIDPPNIPQASSQAGKNAPRKHITLELTLKPRVVITKRHIWGQKTTQPADRESGVDAKIFI